MPKRLTLYLWLFIAGVAAADVAFTWRELSSMYLLEWNPIAALALSLAGLPGVVLLKVFSLAVAWSCLHIVAKSRSELAIGVTVLIAMIYAVLLGWLLAGFSLS